MATAESQPQSNRAKSNQNGPLTMKRKILWGFLALLAIAAAFFLFNLDSIKGTSKVGVTYASHIVCSCRYIEGRDLDSCATDLEDGMGAISLSDDPENKRVTASVPLMASAAAEKRGDFGCIILNEEEREALD